MREDIGREGVFARACSGPKWTSRRKRKRSVPASLVAVWILMMDAKAETPRQPDSWVRCLGWQNLEFTAESLSAAVVSTLVALSMPYTVVESAGQLGMTFVVYPIEPDARELMPMTDDLMPSAELISERLGLRVSIHIFAADAENAGKHNVNAQPATIGASRQSIQRFDVSSHRKSACRTRRPSLSIRRCSRDATLPKTAHQRLAGLAGPSAAGYQAARSHLSWSVTS